MIFRQPMLGRVLDGSKTVTRRPTNGRPCLYLEGHDYAVQPGRGKHGLGGVRLRVTSVTEERLGAITENEAQREGFFGGVMQSARERFLDYWSSLYGGELDLDQPVYRIAFVLERDY